MFTFLQLGQMCMCAKLTWECDGTRMQFGGKRQAAVESLAMLCWETVGLDVYMDVNIIID